MLVKSDRDRKRAFAKKYQEKEETWTTQYKTLYYHSRALLTTQV